MVQAAFSRMLDHTFQPNRTVTIRRYNPASTASDKYADHLVNIPCRLMVREQREALSDVVDYVTTVVTTLTLRSVLDITTDDKAVVNGTTYTITQVLPHEDLLTVLTVETVTG